MKEKNQQEGVEINPKASKKQIVSVILVAVCALLLVGGIVAIFLLNYNKTLPGPVKFYEPKQGQYCFQAEPNDKFFGYVFKFDDDEKVIEHFSEDSLIYASQVEGLASGKTYKVSVCYKGKVDGGNSDFSSPINWTYYRYLATPQPIVQSDRVFWEKIDGEGDITYVVDFGYDQVTVSENFVLFSQLPPGAQQVQVTAVSNDWFTKPSTPSKKVSTTVTHKLLPFDSVTFSRATNILTIKGKQDLDMILLKLDEQVKTIEEFSSKIYSNEEGEYNFTVDLSGVIGQAQKIGVKPASKSEFFVFDGEFMFAQEV